MQLNLSQREITLKIVYYGPAMSGKTTNLQALHALLRQNVRGRLMSLDTYDDRTLFFDLLPVVFESRNGFRVKLKLYTVPGQPMHNSTRKMVLVGADGVAFIADSQIEQKQNNAAAYKNMLENMTSNGLNPQEMPFVMQFNKRDLPNAIGPDILAGIRSRSRFPVYEASAAFGRGVLESIYGLMALTYDSMERRYNFASRFGISRQEFLEVLFRNFDPRQPVNLLAK